MSLDQECFQEHLATPSFQDGVDRGYWGLVEHKDIVWPYALLWIAAATRPNSPDRYHLRFYLEGYPAQGPTATVWDPVQNTKLNTARWPKGLEGVKSTFRTDWYNADALYAPWDRIAMYGDPKNLAQFSPHTDWIEAYPGMGWKNTHTIVNYLRFTHELLNSELYHGC